MKRRTALVVLAGVVGLAGPAAADETTFCNAYITSLPATITAQGHYCFDRNLATAITTGSAITISTNFVVLDLNNFKLGGGSAGLGTNAFGISASGRSNLTIRNGNIRGFRYGIVLSGGANNVVENNALDGNTQYGLYSNSGQTVVRNNLVTNTGGSTVSGSAVGIYADRANVRDNVVDNVFSTAGSVTGIDVEFAYNLVDHNLVKLGTTTGTKTGTRWAFNRDNTVLGATAAANAFEASYALIGANYNSP